MISMVHRLPICSSHSRRKLVMAVTERLDCPATYSRIVQCSSTGEGFVDFRSFGEPPSHAVFSGSEALGIEFPTTSFLVRTGNRLTVYLTASGYCRARSRERAFARVIQGQLPFHLDLVGFEFGAHCGDASLHRFAPASPWKRRSAMRRCAQNP